MSAIRVRTLDQLRQTTVLAVPDSAREPYIDALRKAPRAIAVVHLLGAAFDLAALAGRHAGRGLPDWARTWSPRAIAASVRHRWTLLRADGRALRQAVSR